ncbi:FcoT family thioesterase [uncultured Microscilla sp.]|uniref:FcoT family thioesterase n=1 Tax=uncultured Microscilla sp. TaxID=432653 RepID=UPI002608E4AA|nr:FcoT family thioesterase [uncultured Microscilla sp.]
MQNLEITNIRQNNLRTRIEDGFVQKVMKPYRTNAAYLQSAEFVQQPGQGLSGLTMEGVFNIPESCYIDDTGHFNAVEYNICYNQLGYVFLGHCIKNGLIPDLTAYDEDTFFEKQLSNILIVKIASNYKKPINPKKFYGTYGVKSTTYKSKCIFLNTYCNFYDDNEGKSQGEVMLAILHP